MCCDLCPEFDDCENCFESPEYCCPKCPEFEDCPTRLDVDLSDLDAEDETGHFDL